MNTTAEYREYARECMRWAAEAETEAQCKVLLALAELWTQAALSTDGVLVPIETPQSTSDVQRCGQMRVASIKPTPYINLNQVNYVCDRGQTSDGLVADKD